MIPTQNENKNFKSFGTRINTKIYIYLLAFVVLGFIFGIVYSRRIKEEMIEDVEKLNFEEFDDIV